MLAHACGALAIVLACAALSAAQQKTTSSSDDRQQQIDRQKAIDNEANKDPYRRDGVPSVGLLSGKVIISGGGKPPVRVPIRYSCNGGAGTTETDADGRFLISTRRNESVSSMGGGCSIQAILPGFRSEPISADTSIGGTGGQYVIVLHRMERVEGFTFSGTTMLAPKPALAALKKAEEAFRAGKPAVAEKEFRRAVEHYPKFAVAWYGLGRSLAAQAKNSDARIAYEQSVKADPKFINPYPYLAQFAFDEKRWEDLAACTGTIIRLNPFFSANTYVFSAMANAQLGRWDLAEAHAREAIALDEKQEHKMPGSHLLLGNILLHRNATAEAADQLRLYLRYAPNASDAASVRERLAQIDPKSASSPR
jgi:hypothetical protein